MPDILIESMVKRLPQVANVQFNTIVDIPTARFDDATVSPISTITDVTGDLPAIARYILINIAPLDSGAAPRTAVNPKVEIYINNEIVVSYGLPNTTTVSTGPWQISEIVSTEKLLTGSGNSLRVDFSALGGTSGDYECQIKATLVSISV